MGLEDEIKQLIEDGYEAGRTRQNELIAATQQDRDAEVEGRKQTVSMTSTELLTQGIHQGLYQAVLRLARELEAIRGTEPSE